MRRLDWQKAAMGIALPLVCLTSSVQAQTISPRAARERVDAARQGAEALYQSFPRLREIDSVIRQDCSEKNHGKSADSEFCGCASAITMSLWRSGVDPNMVPRLQAFLNEPDASADSFVAFQGPELYGPICRKATGR
jgi:hypothetical protein